MHRSWLISNSVRTWCTLNTFTCLKLYTKGQTPSDGHTSIKCSVLTELSLPGWWSRTQHLKDCTEYVGKKYTQEPHLKEATEFSSGYWTPLYEETLQISERRLVSLRIESGPKIIINFRAWFLFKHVSPRRIWNFMCCLHIGFIHVDIFTLLQFLFFFLHSTCFTLHIHMIYFLLGSLIVDTPEDRFSYKRWDLMALAYVKFRPWKVMIA